MSGVVTKENPSVMIAGFHVSGGLRGFFVF